VEEQEGKNVINIARSCQCFAGIWFSKEVLRRDVLHSDCSADTSASYFVTCSLSSGAAILRNTHQHIRQEGVPKGRHRMLSLTGMSFRRRDSNRRQEWRNYRGDIEYFGVYCHQINRAFLVPVGIVGSTEGIPWLVEMKNKQSKNVPLAF